MPAAFDKLGIHFDYPENWVLDERDALAGENSVSVYSPGGGFWSVVLHPRDAEPAELAAAVLQVMRQEYDELDADAVREQIGGVDLVGFDFNFYCLDLTNTAVVRAVRTRHGTYLVLCQADDREFEQVGDVFRAMTASLLRSAG